MQSNIRILVKTFILLSVLLIMSYSAFAWVENYQYRALINFSTSSEGLPLYINGSNKVFGSPVVVNNSGEDLYLYWNDSATYAIGTNTNEVNWHKTDDNSGNNVQSVYASEHEYEGHFDDGSANDSSQYNNDGTASGATFSTSGPIYGMFSFNGASDYLNMAGFNTTGTNWTFVAYLNVDSAYTGTDAIFDDNDNRMLFRFNDDGDDSLKIYDGSWNDFNGGGIPLDSNFLLTLVMNASYYTAYINSSQYGSTILGNEKVFGGSSLKIGSNYATSSDFFDGNIEMISVYNRPLNIDEVTTINYNIIGSDGYGNIEAAESYPSENNAPTLSLNYTYGSVNDQSPLTTDDLKFNITCTDPDSGDTLTGYVQLYNGSTPYGTVQSSVVSNSTETTIYTFDSSFTAKGETWTGEYWCGDGTNTTGKQNNSVTVNNFDGLSSGLYSCTFASNDTTSCYINLTGYNYLNYAYLNISGSYIGDYLTGILITVNLSEVYRKDHYCYQEQADTSTDCGGLATGSQSTSSVFPYGYIYGNFTKPVDAYGALFQSKFGHNDADSGNPFFENNTLPTECYGYNEDYLWLRMVSYSRAGQTGIQSYGQCYNSTASGWSTITSLSSNTTTAACGNDDKSSTYAYDGDYSTWARYLAGGGWRGISFCGTEADEYCFLYEDGVHWKMHLNRTIELGDISSNLNPGVVNYFEVSADSWGELSLEALNISGGFDNIPVVESTLLIPSTAYTNDTILGYCNASDADGEKVTYEYKWYVDGILNQSGNYSGYYLTYYTPNSSAVTGSWSPNPYGGGKVIDNDWSTYGISTAGYVYMNYTKPSRVESAYWEIDEIDGPARRNVTLEDWCFNADSTTISLRVYVNSGTYWQCQNSTGSWITVSNGGVNINQKEEQIHWIGPLEQIDSTQVQISKFSSLNTSKGQDYILSCRAYDGILYSSWVNSSIVTIQDLLPTTPTSCTIDSGSQRGDTFTASASGSTDADSDAITYHYQFENAAGTVVYQSFSDSNSYTGCSGDADCKKSTDIQVVCKATTSDANSSTLTSADTDIIDTAPTDPTDIAGFPANLYITNSLTVTASGGSDIDPEDSIIYHYKFYNDDDSSILQDWSASDTYDLALTDAHDTIRAYAKSTTTDANSSGAYSETDTVENTKPQISLVGPASGVNDKGNFTAEFTVTDIDNDNTDCDLIVNSTVNASQAGISNGTTVNLDSNLDTDGLYSWYISCNDGYDTNTTASRTFILDTEPPIITWTYPVDTNTTVSTSYTATIDVFVEDPYLDMTNVTGYCSNGTVIYNNQTTYFAGTTSENLADAINFTSCGIGTHIIETCVRDSATHSPDLTSLSVSTEGFRKLSIDSDMDNINSVEDEGDMTLNYKHDGKELYNLTVMEIDEAPLSESHVRVDFDGKHFKETYKVKLKNKLKEEGLDIIITGYGIEYIPSNLKAHFFIDETYYRHYNDVKEPVTVTEIPLDDNIKGNNDINLQGLISYKIHIAYVEGLSDIEVIDGKEYWVIDPITGGVNHECENVTYTVNNPPTISNVDLTLTDLLNGQQTYSVSYDVSDPDGDNLTCNFQTQLGNTTLTWNSTGNYCTGTINITQNDTNQFIPYVNDSYYSTNSTLLQGVEVSLDSYLSDSSKTNNLSIQNYLVVYNITNHLTDNYTNVQFQANVGDTIRYLNLTSGTTVQNNETEYSNDFITEEADYTIPGSSFNFDSAYNIYKRFNYTNTLAYDLPQIEMSVLLYYYSINASIYRNDSGSWTALTSNTANDTLAFNLSSLNASSAEQYNYSYDAIIATWSGESSADYELSGEYRLWTLDRTYYLNFNKSGSTFSETIPLSEISEWPSRTGSWSSVLQNNRTNETISHTATDFSTYVTFSFSDANYSEGYDYVLSFFTIAPLGGGGDTGGGGGGGGGGAPAPTEEEIEERVEEGVTDRILGEAYLLFARPGHNIQIKWFPYEGYWQKDVNVQAVNAGLNITMHFTSELRPYFDAYICDYFTGECSRTAYLKEDEKKFVRIIGNFSSPGFEEEFITENGVSGIMYPMVGDRIIGNSYNITVTKYFLFDKTLEYSQLAQNSTFIQSDLLPITDWLAGYDEVTQKSVRYLIYITGLLIAIAILGLAYMMGIFA